MRACKGQGLAANSVNRSLAALRGFYKYLLREKKLDGNPVAHIELARVWMHLPDVLSREEMNRLLLQPGAATPAALRDSAMLELMYATGIRVSELTGLTLNSINWQVGYLVAMGKGSKERIVPMGQTAAEQVKRYLERGRPPLLKQRQSELLFLNRSGKGLTRQGFWKIVKKYATSGESGQEGPSAHLPSFLCHPSAGGRGGPAFRADHAGACRYFHDADLHARDTGQTQGDPSKVSSAGINGALGESACRRAKKGSGMDKKNGGTVKEKGRIRVAMLWIVVLLGCCLGCRRGGDPLDRSGGAQGVDRWRGQVPEYRCLSDLRSEAALLRAPDRKKREGLSA